MKKMNFLGIVVLLFNSFLFAATKEPFESLENIYGTEISLSDQIVKEGKYSLKFSGTIDKSKEGGVNFYKEFKTPVDLSGYSFLSLWVYPDSEDGTYSVELRMVVKSEGKISWLHIGTINPSNAPNRKWTQLTFDISEIPRKEVLRVFDIVAWNNSGEYTDKERVIFYFDDLEFFTEGEVPKVKDPGITKVFPGKIIHEFNKIVEPNTWYRLNFTVKDRKKIQKVTLHWGIPEQNFYLRKHSNALIFPTSNISSFLVKSPSHITSKSKIELTGDFKDIDEVQPIFSLLKEKKAPGYETFYQTLGSIGKEVILFQSEVRKDTKNEFTFKPLRTLRISFKPASNSPITFLVGQNKKMAFPLITTTEKGEINLPDGITIASPYCCSYNLYLSLEGEKPVFGIGMAGSTHYFYGPYPLPSPIKGVGYLRFEGCPQKRWAFNLVVEGPLYTAEELDRMISQKRMYKQMEIEWDKKEGIPLIADWKDAPEELKIKEPMEPSEWIHKAVVYHTGSRFKDLLAQLPKLEELGINTILLRPVQETGIMGFGSDCCVQDYFSLNPSKGSKKDLKELIANAHQRGMKVIYWLVPNHAATSNPLIIEHPEYFYRDGGLFYCEWWDVFALDYRNPDTWKYMASVGRYWVKEYGLDGFGLDVPDLIPFNFWRYFKSQLLKEKKDVILLGESSRAFTYKWGMDFRWGFLFSFTLGNVFKGIASPKDTVALLLKRGWPNEAMEVYYFPPGYSPKSCIEAFGSGPTKVIATLMCTLPGTPQIWDDGNLFSDSDPYNFIRKVLLLRKEHPVLRAYKITLLNTNKDKVVAYLKSDSDKQALVIVNFSDKMEKIEIDISPYGKDLLGKKAKDLIGGEEEIEVNTNILTLSLPPYQSFIFLFPWELKD